MTINFFVLVLFILLGALNLLELTTPIARLSGMRSGDLSAGLQLQSSLSILSRVLNTFFMPVLGYVADKEGFENLSQINFMLFALFIPLIMLTYIPFGNLIYSLYHAICLSIKNKGSIFSFRIYYEKLSIEPVRSMKGVKFFRLRLLTVIAFIPLYLSWPIIFLLLKEFHEYRGLILGSSSIVNGINTLLLVLVIDPFLIKASRFQNVARLLFVEQVKLRYSSVLIGFVILLVVSFLI